MKRKLRVLVGCECSGRVRDAFLKRGWDAYSCDIRAGNSDRHIQGDVLKVLDQGWDLGIFHPPCTYLANSGVAWMNHPKHPYRFEHQQLGAKFFMTLASYKAVPFRAVENPRGCMSTKYRKPDQYIQPTQFGHSEEKSTGLWLYGLPKLQPVEFVKAQPRYVSPTGKTMSSWFAFAKGNKTQKKEFRSITFQGIADAMADQWGHYLEGILK